MKLGEPSSKADLEKYLPQLPSELPEAYLNFLRQYNGTEGDLPVQPYCFQLWKSDELSEANKDYEIQNYLPGYFGIGGNGGGELIAFNLKNQRIFAIPFCPMDEQDALLVAENFEEFEKTMGFTIED